MYTVATNARALNTPIYRIFQLRLVGNCVHGAHQCSQIKKLTSYIPITIGCKLHSWCPPLRVSNFIYTWCFPITIGIQWCPWIKQTAHQQTDLHTFCDFVFHAHLPELFCPNDMFHVNVWCIQNHHDNKWIQPIKTFLIPRLSAPPALTQTNNE